MKVGIKYIVILHNISTLYYQDYIIKNSIENSQTLDKYKENVGLNYSFCILQN